jgi:broad specificity phosphatase PhoE
MAPAETDTSVAIVYETHATTEDNERGIATGWLPGRLSPLGRRQAEELGQRRRGDAIDVVYSSDLARALETAEIALADSDLPVIADTRLRECDYGDLNGAPIAQLGSERARRVDEPFPGGESYRDVVGRVADLLDELRRDRPGQRVLMISHSAPQWALDHLLLGEPLEELVTPPFAWQPGWEYTLTADGPPETTPR